LITEDFHQLVVCAPFRSLALAIRVVGQEGGVDAEGDDALMFFSIDVVVFVEGDELTTGGAEFQSCHLLGHLLRVQNSTEMQLRCMQLPLLKGGNNLSSPLQHSIEM